MASYIGIDLGTTYSMVSYLDDTGRPQIIRNAEGQSLTPSCIEINGDEVTVGEIARKGLGWNDKVIARFKRDMGTSEKYKVGDKEFTPTECSVFVLKKLLADAKAAIGEVGEAVVTIPANFTNEARVETLTAAKLAGLNVKNIVNEPTAAALYYVFQNGGSLNGNYAVYDLGGGTFDISIIEIKGSDIEVINTDGVSLLGGDDFDEKLIEIVRSKWKDQVGEDLEPEDFTKNDAEEQKKILSEKEKTSIKIATTKGRHTIEVSRAEFEDAISTLIAQSEMTCENAVDEANLSISDINEVILVGGSTRMPCIQSSVEKIFKKVPKSVGNPDEAVALGAALYVAYKADPAKLNPLQKQAISKNLRNY